MAKPKSLKLRTLVTLHALYKYSDENHRFNTTNLNEHLRPYGLECTSRVLGETARTLREFGLDVQHKGQWDNQGLWLNNRPLSDAALNRLVFAVSTNPHLSKSQATDILQSLAPLVTVYQEPLLCGTVDTEQAIEPDDTLYWVYSVIQEAITSRRRVRYTVDYTKYNVDNRAVEPQRQWSTLFTPKCFYQSNKAIYVVGYNHPDQRIEAVNLQNITDVKFAFKHNDPYAEATWQKLESVVAKNHVPGECDQVIYTGPITFCCKGQYAELYNRFGPPCGPVEKDRRCRTTYPVDKAEITTETLFWLERVPGLGIRVIGPDAAKTAIQTYYEGISRKLLSPNPLK